jgi:hypothetical protein
MKFIIEVLEEWPTPAKERGSFKHIQTTEARSVIIVDRDDISGSAGVLQGPGFEKIPDHAAIRVTLIDG